VGASKRYICRGQPVGSLLVLTLFAMLICSGVFYPSYRSRQPHIHLAVPRALDLDALTRTSSGLPVSYRISLSSLNPTSEKVISLPVFSPFLSHFGSGFQNENKVHTEYFTLYTGLYILSPL
jgi:hypothetical protein